MWFNVSVDYSCFNLYWKQLCVSKVTKSLNSSPFSLPYSPQLSFVLRHSYCIFGSFLKTLHHLCFFFPHVTTLLLCVHLPIFLLHASLLTASPTALCVYASDSDLAECVPALVALTGPDNSRSAFICQSLHLWAAQSRGELAALFVLSPSGDGSATKRSLQV